MSLPEELRNDRFVQRARSSVRRLSLPWFSPHQYCRRGSKPCNWKQVDKVDSSGVLLGCDYAGDVEEVGPTEKYIRKGRSHLWFPPWYELRSTQWRSICWEYHCEEGCVIKSISLLPPKQTPGPSPDPGYTGRLSSQWLSHQPQVAYSVPSSQAS